MKKAASFGPEALPGEKRVLTGKKEQKLLVRNTSRFEDLEKVFQIFLKFSFYVLAAAQAFELQNSFPVDGVVAGETRYLVTLADDSFLIQENGQIYVELFQIFFGRLHFGYAPRENTEDPEPLVLVSIFEPLQIFEIVPAGLAPGCKESQNQNLISGLL